MATETKPVELGSSTGPFATTYGMEYRIIPGAPLIKFVNARTGGTIITRDVAVYRRLPEWREQPFDLRSPIPRTT